MAKKVPQQHKPTVIFKILVEMGFIIFLFYSNLLMGEFTHSNGQGKSLGAAIANVVSPENFLIAAVTASVGYLIFEYLRKRL